MMHHDVDGKLMDSTALMVVDGLLINFFLRLDYEQRMEMEIEMGDFKVTAIIEIEIKVDHKIKNVLNFSSEAFTSIKLSTKL